jgi:UDP-N-acetylmuramoylalanine--D-glutamate ligase
MTPLVDIIVESACGVAFYGKTGPVLHEAVSARGSGLPSTRCETMDEALSWCWMHSRPGDAILLSPACSSHDQFRNFRQRGEAFKRMVAALAEERKTILPRFKQTERRALY